MKRDTLKNVSRETFSLWETFVLWSQIWQLRLKCNEDINKTNFNL